MSHPTPIVNTLPFIDEDPELSSDVMDIMNSILAKLPRSLSYGLDWASLLAVVLQLLEDCDMSAERLAKSAKRGGLFARFRLIVALSKKGYRGQDLRQLTNAILETANETDTAKLEDAIFQLSSQF
jgi:hypothetical protein